MKSERHRLLFWTILALFAGLVVWWIGYVPYRPDAVFGAIPAESALVTVHRNLAGELSGLLSHPTTRGLVADMGVREEDLNNLASNRETQVWLKRLASDQTVLAYVPAFGYQRQPAWVFASWIGNQSQQLRWKLNWMRSSELRPLAVDHGRTIWLSRAKFAQPGQRLSLALGEGLLLGAISTDPAAVRWVLETADGNPARPSVQSSGMLTRARSIAPADRPHWGWFPSQEGTIDSRFAPDLIAFGASLATNGLVELSLVAHQPLPDPVPLSARPGFAALSHLLGATPDLVSVLPLAWARPLVVRSTSPLWAEALVQLTDTHDTPADALAFLAVLDRAHSGRIRGALGKSIAAFVSKGLRVPTVVMGIEVSGPEEGKARVARMMGVLNSRYGLELTARPLEGTPHPITLVTDNRKSFYGKFEPEECIAFAQQDRWLILASNAAMLNELLTGADPDAAPEADAAWQSRCSPGAPAYAWVNLRNSGKTLKDVIAVSQLALAMDDRPDSTRLAASLAGMKAWVDGLQALNEAALWVSTTGGVSRVDLALGPP